MKENQDNLPPENDIKLRDHEYDGIQEYDQRLPNWWLWTFYGAIIFTVIYWVSWYQSSVAMSDVDRLEAALEKIESIKLAGMIDLLDDDNLWDMAANSEFVAAGDRIYKANCVSCHGKNLEGGIGLRLSDAEWKHGAKPTEIFKTIDQGVISKGMQAWGTMLGPKKIAEVTSFILSHHNREEMKPMGPE